MNHRRKVGVGTNRRTLAKVLRSSVLSTAISAIAGLFVLPRVLHGVDVTRYGEWATLAAILAIGQLADAGVCTEISRRVATAHGQGSAKDVRRAVREGTTVLFGIALLLEIAGLVLAHPVVNLVFTTVSTTQRRQLVLLFIGVVTLLTIGLVGAGYFGILTGLQRSDYANWSAVASIIVGAVITVVGIGYGLGLWALLLADTVQLLVGWLGPIVGIRRHIPQMRFRLVRISLPVALGFVGMPAMIVVASACNLFDAQVDKLVLAHFVGPRASAMFQIGSQLPIAAKTVSLIPLTVLLVGTAELYRTDPRRLRRLEALADRSAQAVSATVAGAFIVFAAPFLHVWLGPGYGQAVLALRLMAVAVLLNLWTASGFYYALGRGRYHYVLVASGVNLLVNALATIFLTSRIGLPGALIGSLAGNVTGTLVAWIMLTRWEHRNWLRAPLRAVVVVAPVVALLLALRSHIPATWFGLAYWALGYIAACLLSLVLTHSLPVTVTFRGLGLPRLAWRDESPAHLSAALDQ